MTKRQFDHSLFIQNILKLADVITEIVNSIIYEERIGIPLGFSKINSRILEIAGNLGSQDGIKAYVFHLLQGSMI